MKQFYALYVFLYSYAYITGDFHICYAPVLIANINRITVITMVLFEMNDAFDFYVKLDTK